MKSNTITISQDEFSKLIFKEGVKVDDNGDPDYGELVLFECEDDRFSMFTFSRKVENGIQRWTDFRNDVVVIANEESIQRGLVIGKLNGKFILDIDAVMNPIKRAKGELK